jgi:hypothetical protein
MAFSDGRQSAARETPVPGEVRFLSDGGSESGWIDRLVELHVLAEHGDDASARAAQNWLAEDLQARQVWGYIEHVRDQVHTATLNDGEEPDRAASNHNPELSL